MTFVGYILAKILFVMYVVSYVEMADVIVRHPQYVSDLMQLPLEMVKKNLPMYVQNSDAETLRWLYQEIQDLIQISKGYESPHR
jgi:uncharacterized membrane protein